MDGSGYGVTVCAVISCQTNDIATCGARNESFSFAQSWNTLEISGQFPIGEQYLYFPTTLRSSIMPLNVDQLAISQTFSL